MHARAVVVAAALPVVLALGRLSASTPAQSPAPQQTPTVFRSGVELVRLDVRVTDGSGRPIADLRPEEIAIVEDGDERPVLLFQRIAESGRSYLETVQRTVAAEVSTNQGAPRGQLYVLIFDQEHITAGAEPRVRQAAEAFFRQRVRPQDRVAVFGIPGPGPSQPFTANVKLAIDQLARVRGDLQRVTTAGRNDMRVHEAYEILRGNEEVLGRFLMATNGALDRTGVLPDIPVARAGSDLGLMRSLIREHAERIVVQSDASARRFLEYTAELLRTFRGIDGRKTIVLFSEGFHNDNVTREIERVASAAAETYSVIYAFDLNARLDNLGEVSVGADQAAEIASRLEPLGGLALETNGALVIDAANRIRPALDALAASETDYYILGFEASGAAVASRGQYRRISVRVKRPGARVSARTGYSAGPAATPADRRPAIDLALGAPFSQQGLRVEYTTYVGQSDTPGRQSVVLSLEADLPVGRPDQSADVVFAVRHSTTGQVAASGSDRIALPPHAEQGSRLGRSAWRVKFDLPAGTYLMRCVVREPGGLVGTADRYLVVRSLSGPDVAASDLILGAAGQTFPVRTQAYTGEMLGGAVRLYGRSAGQLETLTANLDLTGIGAADESAPARSMKGAPGDVVQTARGVTRDVSFTMPMHDLPPGDYVARVIVRSGSEVVADLRRQVQLVAGTPPPAASTAAPPPRPRDVLAGAVARRLISDAARSADATIRRAADAASRARWAEVQQTLSSAAAGDLHASRLRALARLAAEEYAAAAADLQQEFLARPDDAAVAFVLGWARVGAADDTAAISAFRSAAFLEPTLVPAHLAIAEIYVRIRQPALAIQALEAGLANVPNSPELTSMLAAVRK